MGKGRISRYDLLFLIFLYFTTNFIKLVDWFFSCKVFLVVHCSRYEKIMLGKFLQQRRRTLEKKLQH